MLTSLTGYISSMAVILQYVMFCGIFFLAVFLVGYFIGYKWFLRLGYEPCKDFEIPVSDRDLLCVKIQKVYYQAWQRYSDEISKSGEKREPADNYNNLNDSIEKTNSSEDIARSLKSALTPPEAFLQDAVFQYGLDVFESKILIPYENLVNLFPPLGFLGTIIGMTMLFMDSKGDVKSSLSTAGMGTALFSTIIALVAYLVFESFKMGFQPRAEKCIRRSIEYAKSKCAAEGKTS
ncbi:MotA/TolQ/ExbB proton channel family protein [Maridesulfovibrio sp.]|uniref:MotA/TolQ/ExbB proton channel family protein n=1 Tax=Maridesulfovibrio sp. TaxID=2795000 RepID=UPI002A18DC40|nr:MotA/TolQ/ExbB proton channel family protein [Maridesulfovibrio sp.]